MTGTRFNARVIRAPRGRHLNAKSWLTEAPLRMLMNNLDPDNAENPNELVDYGDVGRDARNWECYDHIVETLKELNDDETLLIQSGKPFQTSGCPGKEDDVSACTRPYGDSSPSDIFSFPFALDTRDIATVKLQLADK